MLNTCRKTSGCLSKTIYTNALRSYENHYTEVKVVKLAAGVEAFAAGVYEFACPHDDYNFVAAPEAERPAYSLADHVRQVHKFEPNACEHGC